MHKEYMTCPIDTTLLRNAVICSGSERNVVIKVRNVWHAVHHINPDAQIKSHAHKRKVVRGGCIAVSVTWRTSETS